MREIRLPAVVRERARQAGAAGADWLAGLPELVAGLERAWSITVGDQLGGGSAAFVARARTADGADAVLKVELPGADVAASAAVLAAADGRGYVRLLTHDVSARALLLEALGPSLARLGTAPEPAITILCAALRQAWEVPRGSVAEPVEPKAVTLARDVVRTWGELGEPCSRQVLDEAVRCADRRSAAFDLDRSVVVHGDPHPGNALRRLGGTFVFVDPESFLAEPAYDLGVVLRDWSPQLAAGDAPALARRWCRRLAGYTGVAESAIWDWAFLERVSTGLHAASLGLAEPARALLDTARLLV